MKTLQTWMDITVSMKAGMVHWPNNPPVEIQRVKDVSCGDSSTVSALSFGSHTGTHMDAPFHFLPDGQTLDQMPLEATIGPARVINITDPVAVRPQELEPYDIKEGERILLRTENSSRCWDTDTFVEDFVYIPHETAQFLAEKKVLTVGVDYLSVGGYKKDGKETHQTMLGAGIWIIEGLNLQEIEEGEYDLICLPLKIDASDGAPARAVLKPR